MIGEKLQLSNFPTFHVVGEKLCFCLQRQLFRSSSPPRSRSGLRGTPTPAQAHDPREAQPRAFARQPLLAALGRGGRHALGPIETPRHPYSRHLRSCMSSPRLPSHLEISEYNQVLGKNDEQFSEIPQCGTPFFSPSAICNTTPILIDSLDARLLATLANQ